MSGKGRHLLASPLPASASTRRLPKQPSLEQLRKQAKDLLKQYRAGDAAAVAEVARFERRPDPATFALHDAQRVLARAYGYESWPKLKAFVDGANVERLAAAVKTGDAGQVRVLLSARPELVSMDMAGNDERRALHYAVLRRDAAMVKILLEAGADARKGVFPHRDATSALTIAKDRGYGEIVAVMEEEERLRREEMSCPNATISDVQEQVHQAIRKGEDAAAMRLLEEDGSLIQACDRDGRTPLHIAAQETNEKMSAWLLERRASVRKQDLRGWTALDCAAMAANPQNEHAKRFPAMAKLLLEHGAEMTIRAAVALGEEARVRERVQSNPEVLRAIDWSKGGLLSLAVNHGQMEMVRLLLDLGADMDERTTLEELEEPTQSWGTPLWYAALAGQREIVELLLDRGADPNANVYASGWPLRNARGHKDQSVKRLLLARGAKPRPYMVAEEHDVDEAKRLLKADASEELGQELAWSAADHGCAAIVEMALARLKWAASDARWHWILIQPIRGVGTNRADHEGHFACMEVLLRYGVDPNVARLGQTALHFAAARQGELTGAERARFAAMLLDHGARFEVRDEMLESTPLGWACRWGRKELAELLIARGAPVQESEAQPWATPMAWAEKMGHEEVAAMLRRHEKK
ncbi:MAG: ankyrin repeat domain-containing protein [Candidatus Acidiferrum sp.]